MVSSEKAHYHLFVIYSKFSQMADSKMAVLADWRVEFGNPFSQMAAIFPQIGGFYVKLMQKN